MPFSFIDIEQEKSRIIGLLFVFIVFFYFLTAFLVLLVLDNTVLAPYAAERSFGLFFPPMSHILAAIVIAFLAGYIHWTVSTSNLIEKMSLTIGAAPVDTKDTYHQYLKNIIDEVSVAIGGRPLEALVISSASMNAFALEDFQGRAVIGVTEGLLSRLSRAQIEAVVGHEAGHIISGDCLSTTVTCALAEIYEASLSKIGSGLRGSRGKSGGLLVLLFLVIGFMSFLSKLIRYFISRQREYRADAIGVRLTRDPLSLAEALKLISTGWRGEGAPEARLQSIFIVNPAFDSLDESEGQFADMFSTHPPISKRIAVLTNMAHVDDKTLEDNLKNFKRVSPVATAEVLEDSEAVAPKWFVFIGQEWSGPFGLEDLMKVKDFKPDAWVRQESETTVRHAFEEEALLQLFKKEGKEAGFNCPHCKTPLQELSYEGVPVKKCSFCGGVFAEQSKISRILIRRDKSFPEDTVRLAEVVIKEKEKFASGATRMKLNNPWILDCPACGRKMRRQFFVYSYPVEIDRCIYCEGAWFDRQELEILQYLYEHREQFFEGGGF